MQQKKTVFRKYLLYVSDEENVQGPLFVSNIW